MPVPVLVTLGKEALGSVVEIESTVEFPTWTPSLLAGEFSNDFSTVFGVRQFGRLVAYLIVHVVADEVHIVNLAVHTDFRRQGVARFLLTSVFQDLFWNGARQAYLEVRPSNKAAICLYTELGFQKTAERKQYYSNNQEDAFIYSLDLMNFNNQQLKTGS